MSAVRNRIFEDFSESGIVRNRVLLGKMSTKKRNAMKDKSFNFPAFFTKKNQKYKRNPPRPPPFFGRLWRGITVFWHCEGGHKNQFRTPLEHFSKRDFFARWARNTRRGGSGGGSAPPAKRYATPENSKFSAVAEIDFGVYFPAFWRGQFREQNRQN